MVLGVGCVLDEVRRLGLLGLGLVGLGRASSSGSRAKSSRSVSSIERRVERRRRVVDRVQPHRARPDRADLLAPVQARDPGRVAAQQLRREVAERADDPRLDQLELAEQVVLAVVDLLRQRVAVAGRPALEDVGDEDVAARQADLAEQLCRAAGPPGRRTAGPACPRWRRAPRRRTSGRRRRCRSRRRRRAGRGELRAARAGPRLLPDGLELLAPLRSAGHGAKVPPRSGESPDSTHLPRRLIRGYPPDPRSATPSRYLMRELDPNSSAAPCPPAPSSARAASAPPSPPPCAPPASTSRAARPRRDPRRRRRSCCCACPTPRSPRPRAPCRAGPLVGHCSGATGLDVARRPHEAFSLHPLMTVPAGSARRACSRGAGCAVAGTTAARAARRRARSPSALGMRATRGRRRGPRRLPRRRRRSPSNFLVDARGRRRAARGHRRRRPRELLAPLVRAAVENWAALGAEAALTGPIARGDEATVARQRAAVAERTPELLPLFDALAEARARGGGDAAYEDDPHHRRDARRARRRTRAGPPVGLVPTMGAFHAGHHCADARRPRAAATRSSSRCSSTPRSSTTPRDLAAYPRTEAQRRRRGARSSASTCCSRPASRRSTRPASPPRVQRRRASARSSRAPSAARATSPASAPSSPSCSTSSQPDVAYFGQKDAQQVAVLRRMVARPRHAGRGSRSCPTVREPDGLALSSRNVRLSPQDRERALGALARPARRRATPSRAGERDAARIRAAAAGASHGRRRARVPRARRPRHASSRCAPSTAACWSPSPPSVGPVRLIDNVTRRPDPAATDGARRQPRQGAESVRRRSPDPQARHAHQARRDARAGRADRDGHRLRPPERARRRGRPASTSCWSATPPPTTCSATPTPCPVTRRGAADARRAPCAAA